jgi:hypothetical protein
MKAVHLTVIRNPFDNIIARMHLAVKKRRQSLALDAGKLEGFETQKRGSRLGANSLTVCFRSKKLLLEGCI